MPQSSGIQSVLAKNNTKSVQRLIIHEETSEFTSSIIREKARLPKYVQP